MNSILGIDVSSQRLDACIRSEDLKEPFLKSFKYDSQGCRKLISWARLKKVSRVVMEATGGYERKIACLIAKKGMDVHVVNPSRIRNFAKGHGKVAKTDRIDSVLIAHFGQDVELAMPAAFDHFHIQIKELVIRTFELKKIQSAEKSRLHIAPGIIRKSIENLIKRIDKEIVRIEKQIDEILIKSEDSQKKIKILCRQKGVGKLTAVRLIALVPELGMIDRRKIASLIGLAPFSRDSGKKKGKRFVSGGRFEARRSLYMPAWVAVKSDPEFRRFYQRLINNGKVPKVAIVAVMRKLLVRLNARLRHEIKKNSQIT